MGWGGYQLGHFPPGWSEWNDRYRNALRSFWRGDAGKVGEFAERFAGSSDVFRHDGRKPSAGINFVAAHDGMTLADLVSYNERHNEANLENNTDGNGSELSCNCGVEGPTADAAICSLRKRQMRNLLASLFLSQGVPDAASRRRIRAAPSAATTTPIARTTRFPGLTGACAASISICCEFVQLLAQLRRLARRISPRDLSKGRRVARRRQGRDLAERARHGDDAGRVAGCESARAGNLVRQARRFAWSVCCCC